MLKERQHDVLKRIIETHIKSGETIGSNLLLAEHRDLEVSSATIRNDMALLEEEGYLLQPHTSAGRIPTEKAYRYYIKHFLIDRSLTAQEEQVLQNALEQAEVLNIPTPKILAKTAAALAEQAVIVAFSPHDLYYTGLSYLLRKPEFREHEHSESWLDMIDRFDEVAAELFDYVDDTVILIGQENPFGLECGLIATRYGPDNNSMLTILGPMRMDYSRNRALATSMREKLQ